MMNKYDLAVFDLDGTLLDTHFGILPALKYTIEKMGYEMLDDTTLKTFLGPPVQDSFAKHYALEGEVLQEIATIFRDYYSTVTLLQAEMYDGIEELFETLVKMGIKVAVATYKREDYALKILRHFGFDKYTDIMYGGDHENKLKKKDIIQKCIDTAGVSDLSKVVMIGDSTSDSNGAEALGVDFVGVTYGFGFKTLDDIKRVRSVGCVETASEIIKFFN